MFLVFWFWYFVCFWWWCFDSFGFLVFVKYELSVDMGGECVSGYGKWELKVVRLVVLDNFFNEDKGC